MHISKIKYANGTTREVAYTAMMRQVVEGAINGDPIELLADDNLPPQSSINTLLTAGARGVLDVRKERLSSSKLSRMQKEVVEEIETHYAEGGGRKALQVQLLVAWCAQFRGEDGADMIETIRSKFGEGYESFLPKDPAEDLIKSAPITEDYRLEDSTTI